MDRTQDRPLRDEWAYQQALWRLATVAWLRWKHEPTEENARLFRVERERAEEASVYPAAGGGN